MLNIWLLQFSKTETQDLRLSDLSALSNCLKCQTIFSERSEILSMKPTKNIPFSDYSFSEKQKSF